jgi:hypothetical protein
LKDLASIIGAQLKESGDKDIDSADWYIQAQTLKNRRFEEDTQHRSWLAQWAITVVTLWLLVVVLILCNKDQLNLSDNVLIALLGTTTLNILGLSFIVLRGHFRGESESF